MGEVSYEGEGLDLWGVAVCWRCGILFNTELDELGRPMRNECQECEGRHSVEEGGDEDDL